MEFETRKIGNTDLQVSTLGLGTAALAGNMHAVLSADAKALIPHAINQGVNYVDTAPYYALVNPNIWSVMPSVISGSVSSYPAKSGAC